MALTSIIAFLIAVCMSLGILVLKIWVIACLLISGVKVVSDDCGKTYAIEDLPAVAGNWFCAKESNEK